MQSEENIFKGVGIEVSLPSQDSFLKIKETLTRIGISSRKEKKLYQSCHILHKQGRYSILHFKELFILDGKKDTFALLYKHLLVWVLNLGQVSVGGNLPFRGKHRRGSQ